MTVLTKSCSKCTVNMPSGEFHKNKNMPDGYFRWCKACTKNNRFALRQKYIDAGFDKKNAKTCRVCDSIKGINDFYEDQSRKDGHGDWCKECVLEYKKLHPQDPEKHRQQSSRFYWQNRKSILAKSKTPSAKYGDYRGDSKRRGRGLEFSITKDEFMLFWQKPCFYCGDDIKTVGLDRVDNAKGYVLGNIVPCCTTCNLAKRGLGRDEFINHCKKISDKSEARKVSRPSDILI